MLGLKTCDDARPQLYTMKAEALYRKDVIITYQIASSIPMTLSDLEGRPWLRHLY